MTRVVSRSVWHRRARHRRVPWIWWQVPIVSAYSDRLWAAAMVGPYVCQSFTVRANDGGR